MFNIVVYSLAMKQPNGNKHGNNDIVVKRPRGRPRKDISNDSEDCLNLRAKKVCKQLFSSKYEINVQKMSELEVPAPSNAAYLVFLDRMYRIERESGPLSRISHIINLCHSLWDDMEPAEKNIFEQIAKIEESELRNEY